MKNIISYCFLFFLGIGLNSISPQSINDNLEKVKRLIKSKDYNYAIVVLDNIIKEDINNDEATALLANVYTYFNKYKEAEKFYKLSLKSNKNNLDSILGLGTIYFFQKKYSEAETILTKYLIKKPSSIFALTLLGNIKIIENKLDEAENYYRSILVYDSTNIEAISNLSLIYQKKGDIESAKKYLELNASLYPDLDDNLIYT